MVLADNTCIAVEGFLSDVNTEPNGHASRFILTVNNINFLEKSTTGPSLATTPSVPLTPFFVSSL